MVVVKRRILVCDTVSEDGVQKLRTAGFDVVVQTTITPEQLKTSVGDFDALVVRSRTKVTKDVIEAGGRLKVVGRAGVGLDNIDTQAAKSRNITVLSTPEAPTNAVAELVIGMMLSLARGICRGDSGVKRGEWLKSSLMGTELSGKTLGVLGMGRIGQRAAAIAKGFGMKIIGYDVIEVKQEVLDSLDARMVDLDTLLQQADFITMHVPLLPSTKNLINDERLKKMKKTAFLVNASRGGVVDEDALTRALKQGWIAGAGLDVFIEEPPKSELVRLPNLVCTPHIGAQTEEAQDQSATILAEKLIETFSK